MSRLLAIALLLALPSAARADFALTPGSATSLAPESYSALNTGLGYDLIQEGAFLSGGAAVANLDIEVVREPGGSVDFVFRLWNSRTYWNPEAMPQTITALTLTGFGAYQTRVGDSSDSIRQLTPGGTAATTASRSADGTSITFTFGGGLAPLARSDLLFVRTNADGYYADGSGSIAVPGGATDAVGLVRPAPAPTPEPSALALLALGAVGFAVRRGIMARAST